MKFATFEVFFSCLTPFGWSRRWVQNRLQIPAPATLIKDRLRNTGCKFSGTKMNTVNRKRAINTAPTTAAGIR